MKHLQFKTAVTLFICGICCQAQGQSISTIAGTGATGFSGDGGPATAAVMHYPWSVATDAAGNVYFSDYYNYRIRKINTAGIVTTIAGKGTSGFSGDGGSALIAEFQTVGGVAIDLAGNLYVSENANARIRKINAAGTISTIAGTGTPGYSGDGGPATAAQISSCNQVSVDNAGNVYIPDGGRVRKINTAGIISTIAGTGTSGYSGDGGAATVATIGLANDVYVDAAGNIYISDYTYSTIRKINTAGIISTYAGLGVAGFSGDGSPATAAYIHGPAGLDMLPTGDLIFCDAENSRVRKIDASGIITTIAGTGSPSYTGDGAPATSYAVNRPNRVAHDAAGNIFVADIDNSRVRKISPINSTPVTIDGSRKFVSMCQGMSNDFSTQVAVTDADIAQTETWSAGSIAAAHGTVVAAYATTTTGGTLTPSGLTYTPLPSFSGNDTFTVNITDGIAVITDTVYMSVNPTPSAGVITGVDSICAGNSTKLTDATTGGVWSSTNTTLATIMAADGTLSALAAGIDTVVYTLLETGCTAQAIFTIKIISREACADAAAVGVTNQQKDGMAVYPNPSTGSVTINVTSQLQEDVVVTVYSITGARLQVLMMKTNVPEQAQLHVAAGNYLLQAITSHGVLMQRLTIGAE